MRIPGWLVEKIPLGIGLDHDVNQLAISHVPDCVVGQARDVDDIVFHDPLDVAPNRHFTFSLNDEISLLTLLVLMDGEGQALGEALQQDLDAFASFSGKQNGVLYSQKMRHLRLFCGADERFFFRIRHARADPFSQMFIEQYSSIATDDERCSWSYGRIAIVKPYIDRRNRVPAEPAGAGRFGQTGMLWNNEPYTVPGLIVRSFQLHRGVV